MSGKWPKKTKNQKSRQSLVPVTTAASKEFHYGHGNSGNFLSRGWRSPPPTMLCAATYKTPVSRSKMSGCWPQRSEEQRLPKSEWPESIETERKTRHSGQFTPKSETGNSPREKSRPTNGSSDFFLSFISRFCLFVLFAASIKNITIGSHNLHSFKQSAA